MFDVSPDDVALLNDGDLRELVAHLCEADLAKRGISTLSVTWGGHQTAKDDGIDVHVEIPDGAVIEGSIPRANTGYQVKLPEMARAAILQEMCPNGELRASIQALADQGGAYVIVSGHASATERALKNRRAALREALAGTAHADSLHTDFYDRTRLATWVRQHPGLIAWVREKVGRAFPSWKPYGAWTSAAESIDDEYLVDGLVRLHLGLHADDKARPVLEALDDLRELLARPGSVVRLVGLSGVGKTRLVQALFDRRLGHKPLPPSLAVYTNLSDNPSPQPVGMVSDLQASNHRAIVIVDNCPSELHGRLAETCRGTNSISVLTVEYDIRDDQPEGTRVVTLEASSLELIASLVAKRFPHISRVDIETIAENSGGNARIAIALAETVGKSESIAGLTSDQLFQRLFRQRHPSNDDLLRAAQACSLLYSFDVEGTGDAGSELSRLAELAGQSVLDLYRNVSELERRGLVQRRANWRSMLPHAIANRLAARALQDVPYTLLEARLINGAPARTARSLSRRLGFLHDQPRAVAIANRWLGLGGLLGDLESLDELTCAMFENIAPVSPAATTEALKRVGSAGQASARIWQRQTSLLRSLAYDPTLFDSCARMLAEATNFVGDEHGAKQAREVFVSLFGLYLSATHATLAQRLQVIEDLLLSDDDAGRMLGRDALSRVLETTHFGSTGRFQFGARSRDYGYQPSTLAEVVAWYERALEFIEDLAARHASLEHELRTVLAQNFRTLWSNIRVFDKLEKAVLRLSRGTFYGDAWLAIRFVQTLDTEELPKADVDRLATLEAALRPTHLSDRVRVFVLSDAAGIVDVDDPVQEDFQVQARKADAMARELGIATASDPATLQGLLPEVVAGGQRTWEFGAGLMAGSTDIEATWQVLAGEVRSTVERLHDAPILRGFLAELGKSRADVAHELLDAVMGDPALVRFLPMLQLSLNLDDRAVTRLITALDTTSAPVMAYGFLAFGRATEFVPADRLAALLLSIARRSGGVRVAMDVLYMRFFTDSTEKRAFATSLLEAGRALLDGVDFSKHGHRNDHRLASLVRTCLRGRGGEVVARRLIERFRDAVGSGETYAFEQGELLEAAFAVQTHITLDVLFSGDEDAIQVGHMTIAHLEGHRASPLGSAPVPNLLKWCDQDKARRYAVAASVVPLMGPGNADSKPSWSAHSKALMESAPDPAVVVEALIVRLRPSSWSGSRASVMERNAKLIDEIEPRVAAQLERVLDEAKKSLIDEIAQERRYEQLRDSARDERFE